MKLNVQQIKMISQYLSTAYLCLRQGLNSCKKYLWQETPQCDETRFSTIQPRIDMTGIRNERWQWKKMMPLIWLYWLHAPSLILIKDIWVAIPRCILMWAIHTASLVSIGKSTLKLLSRNWISIFSNSDLDLNHRHLVSNPKLRLDVSYPYSKFGVNKP